MKQSSYLINGDVKQTISPFDRGFAYGDGVFRTMRVQGGLPMHWHLHYQKLVSDCATIGIVCPSAELLMEDIHRLFIEDVPSNITSVAKIIITRGEGERGYVTPAITTPLRVVIKSTIPKMINRNMILGVELLVCQTRLAKQFKLAGVKHLNRLENIMARMEWRDEKIFDGILLNETDHVIECTMCNIFARFGNDLLTPNLTECGVAGITRDQTLGLSKRLNINVKESTITLNQLLFADEIVVTNSLFGAYQVNKIADKQWPIQDLANRIRELLNYNETF